MTLWLLLSACITILDQITKHLVSNRVQLGQEIPLIPGIFSLTNVHNTGAAFGLLSSQTVLLTIVSASVITCAVIFRNKLADAPVYIKLAMSLALGGALGNLIDRTRLGYVVDFFYLKHWPIFNVADMSIVFGMGLLLLAAIRDDGAFVSGKPRNGEAS